MSPAFVRVLKAAAGFGRAIRCQTWRGSALPLASTMYVSTNSARHAPPTMQSGCSQIRVAAEGELAMTKSKPARTPESRGCGVAECARTTRSYPEIGEFRGSRSNWHSQLPALQYRYASPRRPACAGGLPNHAEQCRY